MRKLVTTIGIAWWSALLCASFLAYFVTRQCGAWVCDGLGRHLMLPPTFARSLLHTDRLWAGWGWFAIDMAAMWTTAIVSYVVLGIGEATSSSPHGNPGSDTPRSGATLAIPAEFAEKREIISRAAARADDCHDITVEPEEEGWSIRVRGEITLLVCSSVIGRQVLTYMRSLVEARIRERQSAAREDQT
jgi:hypothetical protein